MNKLAGNGAAALSRLIVGDRYQRIAVNGFNKAIAQNSKRCTQCDNVLRAGYTLSRLGTDGTIIYQRTIVNAVGPVIDGDVGIYEIAGSVSMADA
ncbi:MAG TPA: hypothetical protein VGQ12_13535 [Candidatus Angelobacter sp.]|nr:hypothetical protein [Candidatus Angelobacter sp.]